MATIASSSVQVAAVIERLQGLLPTIRARREEIERARRLPRELAELLRETGVFSLEVPRVLGGLEASPLDIVRAIELVSAADGSTGWCVGIGVANNGVAGCMDEAGAREVFSNPRAPTAGIFAPAGAAVRVPGGVRVSGRWPFASGVTHSSWVWGGCLVMVDGKPNMSADGPEIVHVFMPISALEVHDTWHVTGLCGTGSHDVSTRDLFVPEARVFDVGDTTRYRPEPLYQLPFGAFVSHIAAVSLGVARGALEELVELAQTKLPTFSAAVLADRVVAQVELARAEAALAAARALVHESLADLWRSACDGLKPTLRQLALSRVSMLHATEVAATVTRTANLLAGGSAIYTHATLQRHMRDADAIAHHFTVSPHVWEDAGRVFMGRTPTAPLF